MSCESVSEGWTVVTHSGFLRFDFNLVNSNLAERLQETSQLVKRNRRTPDQSVAVWETSRRERNAPVSGCLCCSSLLWEMQRHVEDESARPQKKRPGHAAHRPSAFSSLSSCIPSFAGIHIFPLCFLYFLLSFFCILHPPLARRRHFFPPRQDGLSVRLYSCSIFQNGWRMFYLTCLDMCSGCLREGRSTIHQQERQAHGESLLGEVKDTESHQECACLSLKCTN